MGITSLIVAVALPGIITAAAGFPVFAVLRFIVLRRHGEGPQYAAFRRLSSGSAVLFGALTYLVIGIGIFRPDLAPGLTRFIARGGLGIVGPLALLSFAVGAVFSPRRALAQRQREQISRFGR